MKLKVVVRDQPQFGAAIDLQARTFEAANPDVEIERISVGIEGLHASYVAGSRCFEDQIDLILLVTDWIPEAVYKGVVANLDSFLDSNPPEDWPSGWHSALLGLPHYQGHFYALPYHDGPQVLHIRRDLFEDAGERAAFQKRFGRELEPPKTWDEFEQVASFFSRPSDGLYGTCVGAFPDGHNDVYDFLVQFWSRGGDLTKPLPEQSATKEASDFYAGLFEKGLVDPVCKQLNSYESGLFYAQGKAAMMWNWFGFSSFADDPATSKIVGMNQVLPITGGVALNVFWAMAVCESSPNPELAYQFLRHLASPEMDKVTSMVGAIGTRLSTWNDPEVLAKYPAYSEMENAHARSRTLPVMSNWSEKQMEISHMVKERLASV